MWNSRVAVYVCVFLFFISCKSLKLVNIGTVSNITDARLRNKLKDNELDYSKLYLKKVQFTYSDNNIKKSFKGSFVVQKDSFIIVSIYALMGIELIRAKLSTNDVIIIDKHNKNVIKTDYSFFVDNYGVEFDYKAIQSLLTNTLFLYPSEEDYYDGLKKYKHHVKDDYYSFKSIKDRKIGRLNKKSRNNLLVHEVNIYPDIYRIFNIFIKDFNSNQTLSIDYENFKIFDAILFPEHIIVKGDQGIKTINVDLKINYLQINDGGSTHFKIPSSYSIKEM